MHRLLFSLVPILLFGNAGSEALLPVTKAASLVKRSCWKLRSQAGNERETGLAASPINQDRDEDATGQQDPKPTHKVTPPHSTDSMNRAIGIANNPPCFFSEEKRISRTESKHPDNRKNDTSRQKGIHVGLHTCDSVSIRQLFPPPIVAASRDDQRLWENHTGCHL